MWANTRELSGTITVDSGTGLLNNRELYGMTWFGTDNGEVSTNPEGAVMALYYDPKNKWTCVDLSPQLLSIAKLYPGLGKSQTPTVSTVILEVNEKSIELTEALYFNEDSHMNYETVLGYTPSNYTFRIKNPEDVLNLRDLVGKTVAFRLSW